MSIQHVPPAPALPGREPQAMLFTPGARLGWIFRDRRTLLASYPEPEPDLEQLREQAAAATELVQAGGGNVPQVRRLPNTGTIRRRRLRREAWPPHCSMHRHCRRGR